MSFCGLFKAKFWDLAYTWRLAGLCEILSGLSFLLEMDNIGYIEEREVGYLQEFLDKWVAIATRRAKSNFVFSLLDISLIGSKFWAKFRGEIFSRYLFSQFFQPS